MRNRPSPFKVASGIAGGLLLFDFLAGLTLIVLMEARLVPFGPPPIWLWFGLLASAFAMAVGAVIAYFE